MALLAFILGSVFEMVDDWMQIFFILLGIVKLIEFGNQFQRWYERRGAEKFVNTSRWCNMMEPIDMSSWSRKEVIAESRRIRVDK